MKYTLDAENKKIGRVATQAAVYLMGKNLPSFARNNIPDVKVEIKNTSKASVLKRYGCKNIQSIYWLPRRTKATNNGTSYCKAWL